MKQFKLRPKPQSFRGRLMLVLGIVAPMFGIVALASNLPNAIFLAAVMVPPGIVFFEIAWRTGFHANLYDDFLHIRDGKAFYKIAYDEIEGIELEGDRVELRYRGSWLSRPTHKRKTFRIERPTEFVEELRSRARAADRV
jgi:hypothetical protein